MTDTTSDKMRVKVPLSPLEKRIVRLIEEREHIRLDLFIARDLNAIASLEEKNIVYLEMTTFGDYSNVIDVPVVKLTTNYKAYMEGE